ncbi:MAG: UDP-N-acetylmuramoyl-tripeptide--D-alanyl-D-alanine ligase [Clostridia bacterium]|nr:UDP-N-acetylmuramoyl-tripeptide--D-alanyl-D-alanine ligase [Clostridia bacterium]
MLFTIVEIVIVAVACCAASVHYIHVLQMERYQLAAYRQWLMKNRGDRLLKENVLWAFVAAVLKIYLPVMLSMLMAGEEARKALSDWAVLILFTALMGWITWRDYTRPSRKPFVATQRVKRLLSVLLALCLLVALLLELLSIPPYFLFGVMPFLVQLAAMIINPYEARLNASFFKSARKKIREHKDLITIGITGSYGKTNVKFILRELLSARYSVLATPASFNTAMGISRVVNDQLSGEHQVFIAEMGATHVGDIKELVDLVRPKYGILTSIGPRHMDTFGSLENIATTKFELIQGLPKSGLAVFGSGDDYISRLYALCRHDKCRIGLDGDEGAFMRAEGIGFSARGSGFTMVCADGEAVYCRTRLLGTFNIKNILLAAALARKLGLSMEEIAEGVKRLQPIEHRLQLIPGELNVIDDSLNEDADSAFEAMRVIAQMPGRRIVVTPGLGEQGGRESDVNFALGTVMADSADAVILVGRRAFSRSIIRGMKSSGFSSANLHTADDMDDASEILHEISENGDTVLFESRIPDYEDEE